MQKKMHEDCKKTSKSIPGTKRSTGIVDCEWDSKSFHKSHLETLYMLQTIHLITINMYPLKVPPVHIQPFPLNCILPAYYIFKSTEIKLCF